MCIIGLSFELGFNKSEPANASCSRKKTNPIQPPFMLPSLSNLRIDYRWDELPDELRKSIIDLSVEDKTIQVQRATIGLTSVYMRDGRFTLQYDAEPTRASAGQKYMDKLITLQKASPHSPITYDDAMQVLMSIIFDLEDAGRLDFEVPLSSQIAQRIEQWLGEHPDSSIQVKRNARNLHNQTELLRVSFPVKLFQVSAFESWLVRNARATFSAMFKVIVQNMEILKSRLVEQVQAERRSFDQNFFIDVSMPALSRMNSFDSISKIGFGGFAPKPK
jgi:hypothetical protein